MDPLKAQICLKIADGSLYPLLPAGKSGKKKFTLTIKSLAVMEFEELDPAASEISFELDLEINILEILSIHVKENSENRENSMEIPLTEWFSSGDSVSPEGHSDDFIQGRSPLARVLNVILFILFIILGVTICLYLSYLLGQKLSVEAPPALIGSLPLTNLSFFV